VDISGSSGEDKDTQTNEDAQNLKDSFHGVMIFVSFTYLPKTGQGL